ncbi:TetR family transcriptional regulator [Loktanella sp. 3ANDIMAR09]|uniref:TetR family transcriptional regulator C-terminal domain-containing protein n=1 Tax=Loktanella gaetbuli TaxID=2881335 RepID=A0ABS8BUS0_9RHOB|nr:MULTISPECIES: TetR family transcriptional regulator C-terminal domain-containing protein [Loktanella]KQI70330.1 TetR family transcriptional regulator [Loktanella sp. 3ANDIMAR09]MCB5199334.1 TetR family transcriptional regulator C-terminal domain-containing protein [Loktanella gaetbuli]
MDDAAPKTRIQIRNRKVILTAGLEVFSANGFRGATLDQIAREAGLSKPNLLYYFPSKEAIYTALLDALLDTWLDPLRALDPTGDPITEILGYAQRKLALSRDFPRESRLFANEILQGAPMVRDLLKTDLKALVDDRAEVLQNWMDAGLIRRTDPVHLIFSIWSLTQHYADFDVQIRAVLDEEDPFPGAECFLDQLYRSLLEPRAR